MRQAQVLPREVPGDDLGGDFALGHFDRAAGRIDPRVEIARLQRCDHGGPVAIGKLREQRAIIGRCRQSGRFRSARCG